MKKIEGTNSNERNPATNSEIDWEKWRFTEEAVLCFIREGDKIMLIHKKTGLGKGKINAPGGRIELNEKPLEAAIRECQEEIGLTPMNLSYVAKLEFVFTDGYSLRGIVFFADSYTGNPVATFEADPFWCKIDAIPYEKMWEDDRIWLPRVLSGERVLGRFVFENDTMLDHLVSSLDENSDAF